MFEVYFPISENASTDKYLINMKFYNSLLINILTHVKFLDLFLNLIYDKIKENDIEEM